MYSRGIVYLYGSGFLVYRVIPRQYGNGLGSIFKAAMRTVIPILKPLAKAGKQSAKQVAKTHGVGAFRDIMAGQNVKPFSKHRGKRYFVLFRTIYFRRGKKLIEYKFRSKSFKALFISNPSFCSEGSWS